MTARPSARPFALVLLREAALTYAGRVFLLVSVVFWTVFLLAPIIMTLGTSFTSTEYTMFPPVGFSLRWYQQVLGSSWFLTSLGVSLVVAIAATSLSILLGLFGALLLARHSFTGKALIEYLLLSPLIIPGVVIGFALLNAVIKVNLQNWYLVNMALGHALVTLPFTLRSIWSSLLTLDPRLEDAAASLGSTPIVTFREVTLPGILPGIIAGMIIAFSFSFNDVTISVFLVGPQLRTLPVEIMSQIEALPDPSPAAASAIVVGLTFLFFFLIERTLGIDVFSQK